MTAPLINPEDLAPTRALLLPASCSVLFLDVDGVLNRCGKSHAKLEPPQLGMLCHIADETDCKIVVSSTWRIFPSAMAELEYTFANLGLSVHSCTPDLCRQMEGGIYLAKERGEEIQAWMNEHGTPARFCILDDGADMAHLLPHLIKTDSFEGLTYDHMRRAIAALNAEAMRANPQSTSTPTP